MRIENIRDDWGVTIWLDSPQEFFDQPIDFWRNLIYEKKIIFFKTVEFTREQYAEFGLQFGGPWNAEEYAYSVEAADPVTTSHGDIIISPMSNESKRLGNSSMPWHSDIPNRDHKPFPFRSLWIVSNPNAFVSGRTRWMNIEKAIDYLTPEMKELLPRVQVIQQSWYEPGTDTKELPLLKVHPITGKASLRLNYYNEGIRTNAWITGVKIDGILQPDCALIKQWLLYLEKIPELVYEHIWDTFDISIYDNWPFVHARTPLLLHSTSDIRKFYRININHLDDTEWANHKGRYFK
jgi:alpha-ketoglutarate-dependent taurine dioxygenase